MKTIKVMTPITNFNGVPIKAAEKSGENDSGLYVKDLLLEYVGQVLRTKDPKEAIRAYDICMRLYKAKDEALSFEDSDFELIERAVEIPKHGVVIMAHVYEALEEAKKKEP